MSHLSRGCLRCRTRRVKCDEDRPCCRRCILRGELCNGYRDESSLVFRNENEKAARSSVVRRRASTQSLSGPNVPSQASSSVSLAPQGILGAESPFNFSAADDGFGSNISSIYPWAKNVPQARVSCSAEYQAVSQFFEKYVMYPCNHGSSPGFLEHLPNLFKDINIEGRVALRWAVHAAAYGNLSNDHGNAAFANKALQCYGRALSALGEALADPKTAPDDYVLMTVVVLDLFESIYLPDPVSRGSHAEGMAQILRLRGPDQIYGARGWSLFRLSHHRLQKQQLAFRQPPLPESEAWLESLNDTLPYIRIEKDNHQISKICARARALLKNIDNDTDFSAAETLAMVQEMHDLDHTSSTWRQGPDWAYKTLHRSEITTRDASSSSSSTKTSKAFPKHVQLHHDVWIAYEWNYHRTARIILHEHLLECLDRLHALYPSPQHDNDANNTQDSNNLHTVTQASLTKIHTLVNDVLATVPQSLGDIDHEGRLTADTDLDTGMSAGTGTPKWKGVGGYFLLWPIKTIISLPSPTAEQKREARAVWERIRECTGMGRALGARSGV